MTSPPESDERLLIEAAKGDPSRFAELYESNFDRVYAFVARRVRNRSEAEDVTSEVFQRALSGIGRFEWRGAPFAAWLFRIAANTITNLGERAARERLAPADPDPGDAGAPVESLEASEERENLARLVSDLPEDQRRVIVLRFAEQKSIREIAGQLGRSEGAIKQLQFRGLENLRARMDRVHG